MKKLKVFIPICVVLCLLWFMGVDRSWFVETCDDCLWSRDIIEYRLFTVPISERVIEHSSAISAVARELGVPCQHQDIHRWHKQRWWGLLVCCCPCKSGITGLSSDEKPYGKRSSAKIELLVNSNPTLPQEFHQRVLVEHDMEYWHKFRGQLLSDVPADTQSK